MNLVQMFLFVAVFSFVVHWGCLKNGCYLGLTNFLR